MYFDVIDNEYAYDLIKNKHFWLLKGRLPDL